MLGSVLFPHRVLLLLRGFPDAPRKRSSEGGLEEQLLSKLSLSGKDRREVDLNRQGEEQPVVCRAWVAPGACKPFKARCKSCSLTLSVSQDRGFPQRWSTGNGHGYLSLEQLWVAELDTELCWSLQPWTKGIFSPEGCSCVPQTDFMFQPVALEGETSKS